MYPSPHLTLSIPYSTRFQEPSAYSHPSTPEEPLPATSKPTGPITLRLNRRDKLLSKMHAENILDNFLSLQIKSSLQCMRCDGNAFNRFLERSLGEGLPTFGFFIRQCYEAATSKGSKIKSFEILGSFIGHLIDDKEAKKVLNQNFSNINHAFNFLTLDLNTNSDVDLRITADPDFPLINFIGDLSSRLRTSLNGTRRFCINEMEQKTSLDIESVTYGLADLTYCRCDENEQERTEKQRIRVNLLPFLQGTGQPEIVFTYQGLLDLYCDTGHWIKKKNNKWDFCSYILMITQGTCFPDPNTLVSLKSVFRKDYAATIKEYKKLRSLSEDSKMVFILNCAAVLELNGEDINSLLEPLKLTSPHLIGLRDILFQRNITYPTAMAILQILAMRFLANSSEGAQEVPFNAELTLHQGVPHLRFHFGKNVLVIPFFIRKAWEEIRQITSNAHPNTYRALIDLIKLFGRFQEFNFVEKSLLHLSARSIMDYCDVPYAEINPYFDMENKFLGRFALFLLLAKLDINPNIENYAAAIEYIYFYRESLNSCNMMEFCNEILVKFSAYLPSKDRSYYDAGITHFCYDEKSSIISLANHFIYLSNDILFEKGIDWLEKKNFNDTAVVEHHLKNMRVGKVLKLLVVLQSNDRCDADTWKKWTKQLVDILTAKEVNGLNYSLILERTKQFSVILLRVLEKYADIADFSVETEKLQPFLQALQLEDEAKHLSKFRNQWNLKSQSMALDETIVEFMKQPTLEKSFELLKFKNTFPSQVRLGFIKFLKSDPKNQGALLSILLKRKEFLSLFEENKEKEELICVLLQFIQKCLKDSNSDPSIVITILQMELDFPVKAYIDDLFQAFLKIKNKVKANELLQQKLLNGNYCEEDRLKIVMTLIKIELVADSGIDDDLSSRCLNLMREVSEEIIIKNLIYIYKIFVDYSKGLNNLESILQLILNFRAQAAKKNLSSYDKIFPIDLELCILLLNNYNLHFASGLPVLFDVLRWSEHSGTALSKQTCDRLQNSIKNALAIENDRKSKTTNQHWKDLLRVLIKVLYINPKLAEIIDDWVKISNKIDVEFWLFESMRDFSSTFPLGNRTLVPDSFIKILENKLKNGSEIASLKNLSEIIGSNAFKDHTNPADYQRVFTQFCKSYFLILFNENSTFTNRANRLWQYLETNFDTSLDCFSDKPLYDAEQRQHILTKLYTQIGVDRNGFSGKSLLQLFVRHVMAILVNNTTTVFPLDKIPKKFIDCMNLIEEIKDDFIYLKIQEQFHENMSPEVCLCVCNALIDLKIDEIALNMVRDVIFSALLCQLNIETNREAFPLFKTFVQLTPSNREDFIAAFHRVNVGSIIWARIKKQKTIKDFKNFSEDFFIQIILNSSLGLYEILKSKENFPKIKFNVESAFSKAFDYYLHEHPPYSKEITSNLKNCITKLWRTDSPLLYLKNMIVLDDKNFEIFSDREKVDVLNLAMDTTEKIMNKNKRGLNKKEMVHFFYFVLNFVKVRLKFVEPFTNKVIVSAKFFNFLKSIRESTTSEDIARDIKQERLIQARAIEKAFNHLLENFNIKIRDNINDPTNLSSIISEINNTLKNILDEIEIIDVQRFYADLESLWLKIFEFQMANVNILNGKEKYRMLWCALNSLCFWKNQKKWDLATTNFSEYEQSKLDRFTLTLLNNINLFTNEIQILFDKNYLKEEEKSELRKQLAFLYLKYAPRYTSKPDLGRNIIRNYRLLLDQIRIIDPEFFGDLNNTHEAEPSAFK